MARPSIFRLKKSPAVAVIAALLAIGAAHGQGFNSGPTAPTAAATPAPALASTTAGIAAPPAAELTAVPPVSENSPAVATLAAATGEFNSGSFGSVSGGGVPNVPVVTETPGGFGAGASSSFEMAEKVVVDKSERTLYLLRRGRVIKQYPIKLGLNPFGHKQREGDFRTPEGKYELDARNPRSEFFLSIKVSYPNREDAAVAKENGYLPGGLIMIHGQPNVPKRSAEHYATRDWTDGCIALSNADMVDVWMRTSVGIPIEIRP